MCNKSLKQTANSLSSCEAEFCAASDVSVHLEMDSDSARHILQRRGPGGLKHIEIRCLAYNSGYEVLSVTVDRMYTTQTLPLYTNIVPSLFFFLLSACPQTDSSVEQYTA